MTTQRVYSGAPWEKTVGYCRALRRGPFIAVSGTAAVEPDGSAHAPGDAYKQARRCLEIALSALGELGAMPQDVIRTRWFVTDVGKWKEVGKAHLEVFGAAPPTSSMVQVARLIDPKMMVEVEMDAIVTH